MTPDIATRLEDVRARMTALGRPDACLIAVSKAQPDSKVDAALDAGQRVFGENYVQEAKARWPDRRARHGDLEVHLIGPLQTNKADDAVALFDVIQVVDRPRLAAALAKAEAKLGLKRRYLIQVNTGEEPQKAGVGPLEARAFAERVRSIDGLDVCGFMAIPPADEPVGPHFALVAKLAEEAGLPWRSMGMSGDYQDALRLGATHVRIGTGIFGPRAPRSVSPSRDVGPPTASSS